MVIQKNCDGRTETGARLNGNNEVYRAFVPDMLPACEDDSVLDKSLTCAAAVPVLGNVTKGVAKAGKVSELFKVWQASEQAKDVVRALAVFDTNVLALGDLAALGSLPASAKSLADMKKYYERLQLASGTLDLVGAATKVVQ